MNAVPAGSHPEPQIPIKMIEKKMQAEIQRMETELANAKSEVKSYAKRIVELQFKTKSTDDVERNNRITEMLYKEGRKRQAEYVKRIREQNHEIGRFRQRYGVAKFGELNRFQMFIARLFRIIRRRQDADSAE